MPIETAASPFHNPAIFDRKYRGIAPPAAGETLADLLTHMPSSEEMKRADLGPLSQKWGGDAMTLGATYCGRRARRAFQDGRLVRGSAFAAAAAATSLLTGAAYASVAGIFVCTSVGERMQHRRHCRTLMGCLEDRAGRNIKALVFTTPWHKDGDETLLLQDASEAHARLQVLDGAINALSDARLRNSSLLRRCMSQGHRTIDEAYRERREAALYEKSVTLRSLGMPKATK